MLGTPDYIAPEQVRDPRQADIRANVYSLGCTLYYLLAGDVPFPGEAIAERLGTAHGECVATPLGKLRAEVPAAVVAIADRMMAKESRRAVSDAGGGGTGISAFCRKEKAGTNEGQDFAEVSETSEV